MLFRHKWQHGATRRRIRASRRRTVTSARFDLAGFSLPDRKPSGRFLRRGVRRPVYSAVRPPAMCYRRRGELTSRKYMSASRMKPTEDPIGPHAVPITPHRLPAGMGCPIGGSAGSHRSMSSSQFSFEAHGVPADTQPSVASQNSVPLQNEPASGQRSSPSSKAQIPTTQWSRVQSTSSSQWTSSAHSSQPSASSLQIIVSGHGSPPETQITVASSHASTPVQNRPSSQSS